FFFSSRRRHTRWPRDWSSDVCSSDLVTAEEYRAVVTGLVASFGTYTVNEAEKTVITHVEGSVLPDLVGVDQKRKIISLTASELRSEERRVGKEYMTRGVAEV